MYIRAELMFVPVFIESLLIKHRLIFTEEDVRKRSVFNILGSLILLAFYLLLNSDLLILLKKPLAVGRLSFFIVNWVKKQVSLIAIPWNLQIYLLDEQFDQFCHPFSESNSLLPTSVFFHSV